MPSTLSAEHPRPRNTAQDPFPAARRIYPSGIREHPVSAPGSGAQESQTWRQKDAPGRATSPKGLFTGARRTYPSGIRKHQAGAPGAAVLPAHVRGPGKPEHPRSGPREPTQGQAIPRKGPAECGRGTVCRDLARTGETGVGMLRLRSAAFSPYVMHGGLTLSVGEVGAVSEEMFREFFRPELVELGRQFGGLGIHCCADARHQWRNFRDLPGLRLINHNVPPTRRAGEYVPDALSFYGLGVAQMATGWASPGMAGPIPAGKPRGLRIPGGQRRRCQRGRRRAAGGQERNEPGRSRTREDVSVLAAASEGRYMGLSAHSIGPDVSSAAYDLFWNLTN